MVRCIGIATQGVGCGAQRELQRLARYAVDVGADDPAQAGGNGTGQGYCLDLQIEATIALFVTPVGVEPPKESVIFTGVECMLGIGAGRGDLGNSGAVGDAVAVLAVDVAKLDFVLGIQNHGDDVALADAHPGADAITLLLQRMGCDYLGSEELRIVVEVPHEARKVCGSCSGRKGRAAPVVQQGPIDFGDGLDAFDNEVAAS